MRYCTTVVDPEEALEKNGIVNIDNFSETQLTYCLEKAGVDNLDVKTLFKALSDLETNDIRLINSDNVVFEFFTLLSGGFYYAKSIRRLIQKDAILAVKEILTPNAYDSVFKFSTEHECLEDYPLVDDFKNHFISMGRRILNMYLKTINPIIVNFLLDKIDLPKPILESENLRISNEYALKLAIMTRDFIINQSE
jgi:hypothetical protein